MILTETGRPEEFTAVTKNYPFEEGMTMFSLTILQYSSHLEPILTI
jgi:hypothetical protein